MATNANRGSSAARSSTLSAGDKRTPSLPLRERYVSGLSRNFANGTINGTSSAGRESPSVTHSSATTSRCRRSGIHVFLERLQANASISLDEPLAVFALVAIHVDDALDGRGDFG